MSGSPPDEARSSWFHDRYEDAANQIIEFFGGEFITLTGRAVADIGCGDGIIDLGVARKALPARLVGFDTVPVNPRLLLDWAREENVADELPSCLDFMTCAEDRIPADDHSFDCVFSWSAFDHLTQVAETIREIRRILHPEGALLIQVYPFYYSQHGSHLPHWYPDGFAQLLYEDDEIVRNVRSDSREDPAWAEAMIHQYRTLNKITLDGLQSSLMQGGFRLIKVELISGPVRIPPKLDGVPLSLLAVEGAKILAVPDSGSASGEIRSSE